VPAVEQHRPVVVRPQSPEVVWDAEPAASATLAAAARLQTQQGRQAYTGIIGASAAGQQMLQVQGGMVAHAGQRMLQAQAQEGVVEWRGLSPAQAEWHMVGQPRVCGLAPSPHAAAGTAASAMTGAGAGSVGSVSDAAQWLRWVCLEGPLRAVCCCTA
jgi:hypothetical protein